MFYKLYELTYEDVKIVEPKFVLTKEEYEKEIESSKRQFLVYQAENGNIKIDVRLSDETVWLTQKLMAELFQTTVPNINMHLKNIFKEGELKESSTIKDFLIVQKEGAREVNRKQVFL
jgi:hypothetical protein